MTVPRRHKHSEQHRGIVPEDQLGSTPPSAGDVLTASGTGDADWAPPAGGAPTGAAGGVLGGTYPNPSFAADMATQAELDAHTGDTTDAHDASAISYDNSGSGLSATQVQDAIDELESLVGGSVNVATDPIWDAKGDLAAGTGSNTAAKRTIGSNGEVLTADSGETTGMKWAPIPALATSENFVTGDVTMTNANTEYDGPSLSLGAGTYLVMGRIEILVVAAGGGYVNARLKNGSTIEDESSDFGQQFAIKALPVFAVITLGSTTTVKISGISNAAGGALKATNNTNGTTNKASHLIALKID